MHALRGSRGAVAVVLASLSLAYAGVCEAQSGAVLAARRELLDRATAASRAGQHVQAIEYATRAGQILMSLSVRVFLATEYEAVGDFANAHRAATQCVNEAQRDTTTTNRDAIRARCDELVTSVRTRIASVVPDVPSPTPAGLVLEIGGQVVPDTLFGLPYLVNAGSVTITARAEGFAPFTRTVMLVPSQEERVTVNLQRPSAATSEPVRASAANAVAGPSGGADEALAVAPRPRRRARSTAVVPRTTGGGVPSGAVVLMVMGGAFDVAALVFGVMYWTIDRADGCVEEPRRSGNLFCESEEIADRVRPMGTWVGLGWGSFGVGMAAAGAGVLWAVLGRGGDAPARSDTEVDVMTGEGTAGLVVRRRF